MKNVSKQVFLDALTCPALGWISRVGKNGRDGLSLGEMFRIEQGTEVGRRARALYPGGKLTSFNMRTAVKETRAALADDTVSLIFEGAFVVDGLAARADVLRRTDQGWHLIEVKSATNDKDEFIDDMAYTAMVIGRCGLEVSRVSLLLISRDYRLGMPDDRLFREVDHSEEVLGRVGELKTLWQGDFPQQMSLQSCRPVGGRSEAGPGPEQALPGVCAAPRECHSIQSDWDAPSRSCHSTTNE